MTRKSILSSPSLPLALRISASQQQFPNAERQVARLRDCSAVHNGKSKREKMEHYAVRSPHLRLSTKEVVKEIFGNEVSVITGGLVR